MITKEKKREVIDAALEYFKKAGIAITDDEKNNIEAADFGLGEVETTGLEILVYVNTSRVCAKELVMLPGQTCPEHRHPPLADKNYPGKEETFRCRYGKVYLFISGPAAKNPSVQPPKGTYTAFCEHVLLPGQQFTLPPDTLHWFKAGDEGAVVSEFSTPSYDEADIFTDQNIARMPVIEE